MTARFRRFQPAIFALVLMVVFLNPFRASPGRTYTYAQDETPNCTVTPYHIEGQTSGSPPKQKPFLPEDFVDRATADVAAANVLVQEQGEEPNTPVAIILVDDFTSVNPLARLPHGEYTYQLFEQLLDSNSDGIRDNPFIALHVVNIADMDFISGDVAQAVSQRIEQLRADSGVENFVVNMSFALLPCDAEIDPETTIQQFLIAYRNGEGDNDNERSLYEGFGGGSEPEQIASGREQILAVLENPYSIGPDNLNSLLVEAASIIGGNETRVDAIQSLASSSDVDALRLVGPIYNLEIEENPFVYHITTVASAGNYGNPGTPADTPPQIDPPLYPARWPDFVAISATDEQGNLFEWSNDGEIAALGGLFSFRSGESNEGTTFSSVVVSLNIAQQLSTGISCDSHPVDDWEVFDNAGTITCTPTP